MDKINIMFTNDHKNNDKNDKSERKLCATLRQISPGGKTRGVGSGWDREDMHTSRL